VVTLIRADAPGRELVKVGKSDGATRIWVCEADTGFFPTGAGAGLHRHGGDEIFQVLSGMVRFHVDGDNFDVGAGHFMVVPPFTEHGFRVLTEDARFQFIGEIEMGEWVTVIDPDGARRQVEVRSDFAPWHRRPHRGEVFDFEAMMAMFATTAHLLDIAPRNTDADPPDGHRHHT
jgi:hypothetical protein